MAEQEISLITNKDNQEFRLKRSAAEQSKMVANMIEDTPAGEHIPIQNVTGSIMAKVIEWMNYHAGKPEEDEAEDWNEDFLKQVPKDTIFEIMLAANYLDIDALVDFCAKTVAGMIKGKTTEELRKLFDIKSDWTQEEEEKIHGKRS
ncbi:unnamed protein product [Pedinophyceae sp. YPF-701]|nr:unnamed protein product [Pedinophyceae sp. YPF-701]